MINLPEIKKDDKDEIVSKVIQMIKKYPKSILSYKEMKKGLKYKFPPAWDVKEIFETDDYLYLRRKYSKYWTVRVKDKTKTSYSEILSEIAGKSVTYITNTFYECIFLTTAPVIPNSVTNMERTFYGCISLTTAPKIPSSVTNMYGTFSGCKSLRTAPVIPNSVTDMFFTFADCKLLTGTITINANPTDYDLCFYGTLKPIVLTGLSSVLKQLSETTINRNIDIQM